MTAALLAPAGLPRDKWLEVRRHGIGGSDVAAVLGMDSRTSPLVLFMEKIGELDDDDAGEAAEWGNLLEPVVASKWQDDNGVDFMWQPGVLHHPDRPWQIANPDRFFRTSPVEADDDLFQPDGLLEVKTTNQWLGDEWDEDEERMPSRARLQIQHYLDVTGLDVAHVACLIGGQKLVTFTERYDVELAEMIRGATSRFWHDHVLARVPPPVGGSKATADLLGRLYEVPTEDIAVLDADDIRPLIAARRALKAVEKDTENAIRGVDNQIKDLLREKQIGLVDGEPVVTWKQQNRAGYTVAPTTFRALHIPKKAFA